MILSKTHVSSPRLLRVVHASLLAAPGQPEASGVPKVCGTLLREYEKNDSLSVDAITLLPGLEKPQIEERGNVRYHYLPSRGRHKIRTLWIPEILHLRNYAQQLSPDIVHAQPTSEYLLAAAGAKFPSILTIHGLVNRESAGLSQLNLATLSNHVQDALQRRAISKARNIISCSQYIASYLKGRSNALVSNIPNPIDPEFFELHRADWTGIRILSAGIISTRKNQIHIVRACAKLSQMGTDVRCRLVGPFAPGAEAEIWKCIRDCKVENIVEVMGLVSYDRLIESYSWANVVALASREETMPLSLMQGMAAGRAVFGADSAGIPVLLDHGKMGTLFPLDSPDALAFLLQQMTQDAGPYIEKARVASRLANESFHPAAVALQTVRVYRYILNRRDAKGILI